MSLSFNSILYGDAEELAEHLFQAGDTEEAILPALINALRRIADIEKKVEKKGSATLLDVPDGFPDAVAIKQEVDANSRLIAAAPDLLAALQVINGWSKCQCTAKHGDNQNCCVLIAQAAIAKAKGDENDRN